MKTKFTITASRLIGGIAVVTLSPALAIEPPPDNAEPPAALRNDARAPNVLRPQRSIEPKVEKNIPFIGVATATVPDMVSDHLNLPQGTGVIIRTVSPGSPAEKAGLSVNDIILSIGDTAVGNPEALSSTILTHKPGDRISVSLIHKGKSAKVEATLSQRPADLVSGVDQELMLEGLPKDHADRLRALIERHMEGLDQNGGLGFRIFPEEFQNQIPDISHPKGLVLPQNPSGEMGENSFRQSSTIRMMDDDGSIEMKTTNGKTEVTVRDKDNQTVWSGPWNSEEDRSAAPKGIRERVGNVKPGNDIRFQFGRPDGTGPDTQDN